MPHCNTILSQLLKIVGRHEFEKIASAHHEGQRLRKTSRWSQFVALAFGQLGGRQSLRDIESNLNAQRQYSYHLGGTPITRSSLARLNSRQPASCYEALFYQLYNRCAKHAPQHGFRFKNPLYALDASLIDLSLKLFPWSHYALGKGAMKLTVGLDLRGHLPAFVTVTESKKADSECAKLLTLPKGGIIVCDRGYNDYGWYKSLTGQGVFYVTRQRSNATYEVIGHRAVPAKSGVISDSVIRYNSLRSRQKQLPDVRQVVYVDADTQKQYTFITNHFKLSAQTIADIYKQRWQVELFFKWIKQNLKIKSFLGTSKNAVMTQIWVAMCVYLLLAYLKFCNKVQASLQHIIRLLALNLFAKRDLIKLIKAEPPPDQQQFVQAALW
ncbi:IS4 family transposase [Methyloglobulus sp.]|uniref:IS4 family transposase n=1 Tax=Methyloglobulus sp. TaxID=2518622 RepID=UPI00398923B9